MIAVEQALALIRSHCTPMPTEVVQLTDAAERVLTQPVCSPNDLPPFDNSAMDGYALRWHAQLQPGSELEVRHEQAAGAITDPHSDFGAIGACSIMTGACVPAGLDCVVPVEEVAVSARDTSGAVRRIILQTTPRISQNIRRAGEDIARGQIAVPAGTWLGSNELMLLRGIGCHELCVQKRPRGILLCTGAELVDTDRPLNPGEIYNTNGPFLLSELRAAGAEMLWCKTIPDQIACFLAELQLGIDSGAQLIVSTGAVSMGRYDFVPEALERIGATVIFHKVQMRPGKPLLFARLPGGQLFFGLPGNPVSSAVGARFFVGAAIRQWLGLPIESAWHLPLAQAVQKKSEFRLWQKAQLLLGEHGQLSVQLLSGQESFKTRPLLLAKVWAVLPEDCAELPAGSVIAVYPRRHIDTNLFARSAVS